MHKLPKNTLIVVADGTRARMIHNVGTEQALKLHQQAMLEGKDLEDDGPSGSAPPEQTEHQTDEATFAKQLAHHLNAGALKGTYSDLVLIADPQTLGQIRPQLHKETLARLRGEIAKTLTNSTLDDIERALHA